MSNFEDFLEINRSSLEKTARSLTKYWYFIFSGVFYGFLSMAVNKVLYGLIGSLLGPFSMALGFIGPLISAALASSYLYLLYRIIRDLGLAWSDVKNGFFAFFRKVYGIMFIYWIFNMLMGNVARGMGSTSGLFYILINLSIVIFFNALPETLYLKNYQGAENLLEAGEFIRENPVNWFLPNILLALLFVGLTGNPMILLGFSPLGSLLSLRGILALVGFSAIAIYRGHLYELLSTTTKRKRMYMRKF